MPEQWRFAATVLVLACALALAAPGQITEAQRLPANIFPENYKLFLDPNIGSGTFAGEETISLRIVGPVREIILNSLDLEIGLAEVTAQRKTQQAQVAYDKANETVRLSVASPLPAGQAALHLQFSRRLTEGLRGFYLSKTARRAYAVSQLGSTYARMMFPSFDEPGFKATFDLAVMADKGDTAISNGRIIADEPVAENGSARHKLTFSTTPRMSSYLVALAIGDWQCLESNVDSVPIRVCAVPENKERGRFALEVAAHSIEFYDRWYGIKYPYGKLDMVAIPDFEWGGMENTASIFFGESSLLLNESTASIYNKRSQATLIAHEIAHQWFGDLVTAAWWDDIWLNEGFATWMESKPIAAWHPDWHVEEDEATAAQGIISWDSLATTRALHGDPHTSSEIREMFDGITYQKGAAVLRMLESYVGPETFRRGVNLYLQQHANGNATSADFWHAEAQVSGKPVDKIMPTFVMQAGVPVVTVRGTCQVDSIALELDQQRFYFSPRGAAKNTGTAEPQWQIPVCIRAANQAQPKCSVMTGKTSAAAIQGCPPWFFANQDAQGYYRVFYSDPDNLAKIAQVAEKELSTAERIALVEDAWAMTRAGKNRAADFLDLAQAMRSEQRLSVINLLAAHLNYIRSSLVKKDQEGKFNEFVRAQFAPLAQQLGWSPRPGDSDEQKALRANLLGILSGARDPGAIGTVRSIAARYLESPDSVEGTTAAQALSTAAWLGDPAFYDQLSAVLAKPRSTEEYYRVLNALAWFQQPDLAQRTLNLIDQGKVRQQDYPRLLSTLLANPGSRDAAWTYLKAHWDELEEKVTTYSGGTVSALGAFCTPQSRGDVTQFFAQHRAPSAELALRQSLERMDACIEFKQLQESSVQQWLDRRR